MAGEWYYAQDKTRHGPYTAQRMKELARAGWIVPTDTVWLDNKGPGVAASKVRHLFDPSPVSVPQAAAPVAATAPPHPATQPARQKRAVALQGVVVQGQDGKTVRFKKFCTKCRHEGSALAALPIAIGDMRSSFYCTKCSRSSEVLLRGSMA